MDGENVVITNLSDLDRIIRNAVREEIARFQGEAKACSPHDPEYYTPKDLLRIYKISSVTLWRWENKGILKPTRISGKKKYYDVSQVKQLIDSGKTGKYIRQ